MEILFWIVGSWGWRWNCLTPGSFPDVVDEEIHIYNFGFFVYLVVCFNPTNVKMAELIGPKNVVFQPSGFLLVEIKKLCLWKTFWFIFYFWKILVLVGRQIKFSYSKVRTTNLGNCQTVLHNFGPHRTFILFSQMYSLIVDSIIISFNYFLKTIS